MIIYSYFRFEIVIVGEVIEFLKLFDTLSENKFNRY